MNKIKATLLLVSMLIISQAHSAIESLVFNNPEQEKQYRSLLEEVRCLVCQNQSLAESNAELAGDLREIIYERIQRNASNEEIVDFLVSRYGDFVLYRPPIKKETYLLWFGPLILILIGGTVIFSFIKRRETVKQTGLSTEEQQEIKNLLNGSGEDKPS